MLTLKQAQKQARSLSAMHGERWLVFKTPATAPCNQHPANLFNKGRFAVCRNSERADYEAGGADFDGEYNDDVMLSGPPVAMGCAIRAELPEA